MVSSTKFSDQQHDFMRRALALAEQAEAQGEVPVGAIIVRGSEIIAEGHNQPISRHDATAHAEIMAIREAGQCFNNYRLSGCDMYVTLEPCAMCAGAIVHARIQHLYIGAMDTKTGCCGSLTDLVSENPSGHRVKVTSGLCALDSQQMIQNFFKRRRLEKRQLTPAESD